jgi:FkbM family methyltransferase
MALPQPDIEVPARRYFTQCGEDLIIVALLKALAQNHGLDLASERYLEIGANHPVATSATYLLHVELGMRGVLVEANTSLIPNLSRARPSDIVVNRAIHASDSDRAEFFVSNQHELSSLSRDFVETWQDGSVGLRDVETVMACRMNSIFEEYFPERPPLYLSVDVEGLDLDLLRDLDWKRWRPSIVQAEPSECFLHENARQMTSFMESIDYVAVGRTDVNLIFVDGQMLRSVRKVQTPSLGNPEGDHHRVEHENSRRPSVGIVTRTKDRMVLLRRALESVRDQSYPDWQLVVVNDGGASEPVDWLIGEVFSGDPRVRVIHHQESRGMEAASNAGLARLDTDYAIIHDDDDSWAPEFLSVMIGTLRRRQEIFASVRGIVCRSNEVYETVLGNEIIIERVEPWKFLYSDSLDEGFLSIQRVLIRNQFPSIAFIFDLPAAKKLGLFDEGLPLLGDWDFHTRFALLHDVWVHTEYLAFYHHRVSAGGSIGNSTRTGADKHRLYNQKIRNELIRRAALPDAMNRLSLVIPMEVLEKVNHSIWMLYQLEGIMNSRWQEKSLNQGLKERSHVLREAIRHPRRFFTNRWVRFMSSAAKLFS